MPRAVRQETEMLKRGYITVKEAADRMHCSIGTIYRAIADGSVEVEVVGKKQYLTLDSFRKFAGVLAEPAS